MLVSLQILRQLFEIFFNLQIQKRIVVATIMYSRKYDNVKKYFAPMLHCVTRLLKSRCDRNSELFHPITTVLLLIAILFLEGQKFLKNWQTVVQKYDCAKPRRSQL